MRHKRAVFKYLLERSDITKSRIPGDTRQKVEAYMPTITLSRSLLVIILPGVVAVAPWLFILLGWVQENSKFYEKYQLPVNVCLIALVVVVGCIFEGVNSHQETKWDAEREEEYDVEKNWRDYLALAGNAELIGFNYITKIVTSMYFELGMMWASVFFLGAIAWFSLNSMPFWGIMFIVLLAATAPLYFREQAKESHKVLCTTRQKLNLAYARTHSAQTR
jgi:hypothetical protein